MIRDRISNPRSGRYFPYNAEMLGALIKAMKFSVFHIPGFNDDERPSIFLQNCDVECLLGHQLSTFFRRRYVAQFSLPTIVSPAIARKAVDVALARFREIDANSDLTLRTQQFVVYRAYLQSPASVSVTRHVIGGVTRSYLHFDDAAQLSKARRNPKTQSMVFQTVMSSRSNSDGLLQQNRR